MLSELDRKIYAIALALEVLCMPKGRLDVVSNQNKFVILWFQIESGAERVAVGEKEYIVSPAYGASTMQAISNKQTTEHKYWTAYKKPFDWMNDEQFVNLQVSWWRIDVEPTEIYSIFTF